MTGTETLTNLAEAIASGQQSAEETVRACLDRIESGDRRFNAVVFCDRDQALSRASSIDVARANGEELGPLAGVPIAIKDNICSTVGPTTCGSKMLANFHSGYDAFAVEKLNQAGAVVVAKTNLDEFAMGSSTEHGSAGAVHNPWDCDRVAGGSSGGSVAAVAARMIPGALGSDTGGSVRQPASFCGVVGLKPSYGRVSRFGLVAYGSSLDQIGPIATDVRDVATLLGVIAGHDKRDTTCINTPVPDYVAALDRSLKGVRVGVCPSYFGEGLDERVRKAVEAAIQHMQDQGATLVEVELPHTKYAIACYYLIATAEASSNLARFDGVHYGHRTANPQDIADLCSSSRGEGFGIEVKRRIMLGTFALSAGYHDAYYLKALKVRTLIKCDFDDAFEKVDVIASPVAPTTAYSLGEKVQDPLAMYLGDVYTISANLTGTCALSLPCGFDETGLPIGLQLTGPSFGEEDLLAAAHQYQQTTDFHLQTPKVDAAGGMGKR